MASIRMWWTWMTSRPDDDGTLLVTIAWWERRRFSYNLFLAAIGIPGLLLFFLAIGASQSLAPGEDAVEPMALFAAPIAANLAYTAGWLVGSHESAGRFRQNTRTSRATRCGCASRVGGDLESSPGRARARARGESGRAGAAGVCRRPVPSHDSDRGRARGAAMRRELLRSPAFARDLRAWLTSRPGAAGAIEATLEELSKRYGPAPPLLDRVFYAAVAVPIVLALGVYLVVDSVKNQGFGFGSSFRVLILAVVAILGFLAVLEKPRERGS